MGNFSPYSEEWEKQHMNKVITRAMEEYAQRKAVFERLPKPIQLLIIAGEKSVITRILPIFRSGSV